MAAAYELWLTDDIGKRIIELTGYAFFSYSRSTFGYSTFQIGIPYVLFKDSVYPVFELDRRIEVWRSPATGYPMRLEQIYLLRKQRVYTRSSDDVQILELFGRSPIDLLRRRVIIQASGSSFTRKTGPIDDIMKEFVREQTLYGYATDENGTADNERAFPEKQFDVSNGLSLGPSVTVNYPDRNLLDILVELRSMSFQKAKENSANRKIYFDVVPAIFSTFLVYILQENDLFIDDEYGNALLDETSVSEDTVINNGLRFQTYADLYGNDRTTGVVFSDKNGNLETPDYNKTHLEEVNAIIVKGNGRGDSRQVDIVTDDDRIGASRWNRCEAFLDAPNEPEQSNLADIGNASLWKGEPVEEINAVILNTPGSNSIPRSLYGVDWDLGDILPVEYAGQMFSVEVAIVYVSLNDDGEERITGRNRVDTNAE